MTNEMMKRYDVDGVEMYLSADGKSGGMSIRGLARFIGVEDSTLRGLMMRVKSGKIELKGTPSMDLECASGVSQAKVIPLEWCVPLINYYATHPKIDFKQAQYAMNQFALMGVYGFVKSVVGFVEPEKPASQLEDLVRGLMGQTEKLMEQNQNYQNLIIGLHKNVPNLAGHLVSISQPTLPGKPITVRQYLKIRLDREPTRGEVIRLAHVSSSQFKSATGLDPMLVDSGDGINSVQGYPTQYQWCLDVAFDYVFS